MKKLCFSLALAASISIASFGQIGTPFPPLSGQTLDDSPVSIPDSTNGKYTLIGMAYSKKAEQDLDTWFQPVYRKFVADPENAGLFAAFTYDLHVYFIPMFTGAKRVASEPARESAVKRLDYRLHPLVLFYVGGLDEYKKALEFDGKNKPYIFLLDEEGTIVFATSGRCTPDKMEAIEDFLSDL
ncbi:MAG TPA: hypothetical protein DCE41_03850 [Cytophagales bacterium]|nr:hypothetical protein [Cytophagales bacterium]HAA21206.1 hypothetical protein [Cytophagales bacterium]HAP60254.1 hypothetical protein [Cytophagales bacterium]